MSWSVTISGIGGHLRRNTQQYKNKLCVYCRDAKSTTADHVFPRGIFQRHQLDSLPKVPSCKLCNNDKSKLEHYLLSVLPFGATHAHAKNALSVDVSKRLEKNKKLHRKISEGFGYTYIQQQSNILERRLVVKFDADKLHKFVGYVGRGLMWYHWNKLLPLESSFETFTPSPIGIEYIGGLLNLSSSLRINTQLGEGTVRYHGVMSEVDEGVSVWAVQLFGGITIATENNEHIQKNSCVVMVSGSRDMLNKLELKYAT